MNMTGDGRSDSKLIFVHIPKTAGSTLDQVLNREAKGNVCWLSGGARKTVERLTHLPPEELLRFKVYAGHVPLGLHTLIPAPCRYITILRDPVERLVSHYYHVHDKPQHRSYEQIVEGGMSLLDFVASDISPEVDNLQTRFIAGLEANQATPMNGCNEALLQTATQNLDSLFAGVLVQEYFDHSLLLLAAALGWRNRPVYASRRVHGTRPRSRDIPEEVRELAASRNRFDVMLHRVALERVETAVEAGGAAFTEQLDRFCTEREAWASLSLAQSTTS